MQEHRGKMVSLPETLEIDHASSSSSTNAAVDQQLCWNDLRSPPETLLPNDYMLPPNDSVTFMNPNVVHQQRSMNTIWNFGESSSSTSSPFGNSEWKSESEWPSNICARQGPRIDDQLYAPDSNVFSLGAINMNPLCPQGSDSSSPALSINLDQDRSSTRGHVREGSSAENRRLSCKRKSREGAEESERHTHHVNTSSGSSSVPPFTAQICPRPGLGLTRSSAEISQRNFRLRANNSSSGQNSLRPQFTSSPVSQSTTLPSSDLPPPSPLQSQGQGEQFRASVTPQTRTWRRNLVLNLDSLARNEACIPRNNEENPLFVPRPELRALAQNSVFPRNVGSSSASATPQLSHYSLYHQRLFEHARRQGMSSASLGGQRSSSSDPSFPQEVALPLGPSNLDHHHHRSALWMERQANNVVGNSFSMRSGLPSEGRRRLASEIRSVLERVRRGDALRFEDMMMLEPSMLFRVADIPDRHRDMRLDVDNMSYEELLALEERIGNVGTGLTQETILTRIKERKHTKLVNFQAEVEPCCICQEDYNDGEDIGTLDCGHDFHRDCVKQWLTHKNLCPICKKTGLATT